MRPKKISDEDILEVARKCLMEKGPSVSTQVIADQLGVSQATLFKRFGTRLKLLQAALAVPIKAMVMLKRIERAPTQEPAREQLLRLSIELLAFFDEMIPYWATLHSAGIVLLREGQETPPIRARRGLTEWFSHFQKRGAIRQDVDPEAIALALIGALQHRPFRTHIIKDTLLEQSEQEYVEAIVDVV